MRHLVRGWRQIASYPFLILFPLSLTIVTSLLGIGVAGAAMAWAMAGQAGSGGGALLIGLLVVALTAPAIASGYNAMVAAAVRGEEPGRDVFISNLGRHYGRIVGGALLMGLIIVLLGALLGSSSASVFGISAVGVVTMFFSYLTHLWFAALVFDGVGVMAAAARAVQRLADRFADFGPLLGISVLAGLLIPAIIGTGGAAEVVGARSLLQSLLTGAVSVVLRVATFAGYADTQPRVSAEGPALEP